MADSALEQLEKAFSGRDITGLKNLSSEFSERAFLEQDRDLVELSVLAYSLAKFCDKPYIVNSPAWKGFTQKTGAGLKAAITLSSRKSRAPLREKIRELVASVEELSNSFGRFVLGTLVKARIKAGANMYAKGASLGSAADLSGAPKNEIADYVGATHIPEKYSNGTVEKRLKRAREALTG